jgi:tight adherence protein C
VSPLALLACAATAVAGAAAASLVVRPAPRLRGRVRPYTVASRARLGAGVEPFPLADPFQPSGARRLVAPLVAALARLHPADPTLARRLRHAALFDDLPDEARVQEYRIRQLCSGALAAGALGLAAAVTGRPAGLVVAGAGLGAVFGASRWRARVDRAIAERRLRLVLELYTVNQLLAMTLRVGGGVAQALQRMVERGCGEVVGELAGVLALHRSGRRLSAALEAAAAETPEPHAARTYRLLANGVEYGADLADGLRALSADIRAQRADALKRAATQRRAAMLVPIIGVLAPVMLLFVAAPLPSLVFGRL